MSDYDWAEDPTAQDVIDAMRFVTAGQPASEDVAALFARLLEWAPDTESVRGIQFITRLISERSLKATVS